MLPAIRHSDRELGRGTAEREGTRKSDGEQITDPEIETTGSLLFQLDDDVDAGAAVRVVRATPKFSGKNPLVARKEFPAAIRDRVIRAFGRGVVNADTGVKIGMSGRDFKKHLFIEQGEDGLAHLEAIAALPALARTAKRVETHADNAATADGRLGEVRRFISAFSTGGKDYSVLLTVKRFKDGNWLLDTENPVRLYHHRVEKEMLPPSSTSSAIERAEPSTSVGSTSYTIRDLLDGVKDSEGQRYFQTSNEGATNGNDADVSGSGDQNQRVVRQGRGRVGQAGKSADVQGESHRAGRRGQGGDLVRPRPNIRRCATAPRWRCKKPSTRWKRPWRFSTGSRPKRKRDKER
ncbi:MAG: hypothetical protein LBU39_03615 [Desulfobulbaceae bacterium]|nr:hypothetical protein [Desulfobulbaceae bacterium]